MDTALALWIQRFFLYLWVTAWFLLQFRVFGRRFCHRASNMHVPCAARPSKCSKGDLLLKPSCFHFFPPSFFTVFLSPGPDNPPYPWLISRKGTGQQWAQGWVLKMHVLPLNTHTHRSPQGTSLHSCGGGRENYREIKTSTQHNDMHDYRLHEHAIDQWWRSGHFLSWGEINRERVWGHRGVRVAVCVCVEMKAGFGWEVLCQLIVFPQPSACQ